MGLSPGWWRDGGGGSVGGGMLAQVFDMLFRGEAPGALLAAVGEQARAESCAHARMLAALAELVDTTVPADDERALWAFDAWSAAAAEVGMALGVGPRRASRLMRIAEALRYRLPRLGALALTGVR